MDERSPQRKSRTIDAVIAAVNLAAMGSAIHASTAIPRGSETDKLEKKIDDLAAKIERLAEQLKMVQAPQQDQKVVVNNSGPPEQPAKPDSSPQSKPQDVIYVRKPGEFSFYS